MQQFQVKASQPSGTIHIPPSKSHTLRAILFASLAYGDSVIHHYLDSPDTQAMLRACSQLGARIRVEPDTLFITGVNGKPKPPSEPIDAGNSGQVLRFIGAIAALMNRPVVITGDESIQKRRPVLPLLEGLRQLGAQAESHDGQGHAPISIHGPIQPNTITIDGTDSQPVSGLLIASAFLPGTTEIQVNNAGEKPWIGLTLSWFDRLGIHYEHDNFEYYRITGACHYSGFEYTVPGDFSSAAYPAAAALLTQAELTLYPIDRQDPQGDKKLFTVLKQMGAQFEYNESNLTLTIRPTKELKGVTADINDFIDSITILAILGCYAQGTTQITGAEIARFKESNRIEAITTELKKMGAHIEETQDGVMVHHSQLTGATVKSYHDHRMAMSLAIAGLIAEGVTVVQDTACVAKSFPGFANTFSKAGVLIDEVDV